MDLISRQAAIDLLLKWADGYSYLEHKTDLAIERFKNLPSVKSEIIYCRDCKYLKQQTGYNGAPLSFGYCECDYMWSALYGETVEVDHIDTDDDFFCGFAEMREDGSD